MQSSAVIPEYAGIQYYFVAAEPAPEPLPDALPAVLPLPVALPLPLMPPFVPERVPVLEPSPVLLDELPAEGDPY